jgi:hypothetical protein
MHRQWWITALAAMAVWPTLGHAVRLCKRGCPALTNNGIALVPSSGSSILVSFDSKENILTSHAAELELTLASAGPQGVKGDTGATGAVGP